MKRRKINLNDFAELSPWPARMLGLADWSIPKRDAAKIEKEYNKEKYFPCLKKYEDAKGEITIKKIKNFESGISRTKTVISRADNLFEVASADALKAHNNIISKILGSKMPKKGTVIELGCGYGYNFYLLKRKAEHRNLFWLGGEFSKNAVKLGGNFARGQKNMAIEYFNFYETPYRILEKAKGPIIVFTVHAIEQIPSAKSLIAGLLPYKDKIEKVIHLEPVYELHGDSLMGLMRRKYAEICDYNRDLLTTLKSAPEVKIISMKADIFGINPFNPTSIIEWKFV